MDDRIARICALQSPDGGYCSTVYLPRTEGEDVNCFITALVLRELRLACQTPQLARDERLTDSRRRALGYLLRSGYPVYEHAYAFYPHSAHPFWIGGILPPDADDTCVVGLELVLAGKKPLQTLEFIAERYLDEYRAVGRFAHHLGESWQCSGAFLTWFSRRDIHNPVDCCVNANVLALLASAGRKDHPGYAPAVQTIAQGIAWAGRDPARWRRLTPYYPDPRELGAALRHAMSCGADELRPAWSMLDGTLALMRPEPGEPRIFSNEAQQVFWRAPVLSQARALRELAFKERSVDA